VGFVVLDPVLRIRKIVDDMEISLPLMWRKNSSFLSSPQSLRSPVKCRIMNILDQIYTSEVEIFGVVFLNLRFLELQKP
jgi:hypothetical protein